MPLRQGNSREIIAGNIREMLNSHHPHAQAVAAALHTADRYGKHRAAGGSSGLPTNLPAGYGGPGAPANPNALPGWSPGPPSALPIASPSQTTSMGGSAPTAPLYQVPSGSNQGILSSGLMKVPQVGDYTMDLNTGALSPHTQQMLASYAMRGLPPPGGYPAAAQPPAAPGGTTNPNPDPTLAPYITALQNAGADPNIIAHFKAAQNTPYYGQQSGGGNEASGGGGPGGSGGGDGPGSDANGGFARGGRLANGGVPSSAEMAPWFMRSEAHSMDHPAGIVRGIGGGRTDTVPMSVASGSHVVPADVLSGLGAGSSNAGAHAMDMAMSSGPGGLKLPKGPVKPMALPRMPHLARGGEPEGPPLRIAKSLPQGGVKCILASDEYVIPAHEVARIEHAGKKSHEAVDAWILEMRGNTIKTMRKLPPPVKS